MKFAGVATIALALLGAQACSGLYSHGVVVAPNNPNNPVSPTAVGPTGLGRYQVPRPRLMEPGPGEGLPLPASVTPYAALAAPTLSPQATRRLYEVAGGVALFMCSIVMINTAGTDDCGLQIDRSLDLIIKKRPVPISR